MTNTPDEYTQLQNQFQKCAADLQIEVLGKVVNTDLANMLVMTMISNVVNAPSPAEQQKGVDSLTGFFEGFLKKAQPPRTVTNDQVRMVLQKHFKL